MALSNPEVADIKPIWPTDRAIDISGKVDEKATQLHAIASLKVLLDATKPQDGVNGTTNPGDGTITGVGDMAHDSGRASQGTEVT